jgi:hypothetical protein
MENRNARFWVYINGRIKITLKPGQKLSYSFGHATDEGYHSEHYEWEYIDGIVSETFDSSSRDCDGPLCRSCDFLCEYNELHSRIVNIDGVEEDYPQWKKTSDYQRDVYAEAMGY